MARPGTCRHQAGKEVKNERESEVGAIVASRTRLSPSTPRMTHNVRDGGRDHVQCWPRLRGARLGTELCMRSSSERVWVLHARVSRMSVTGETCDGWMAHRRQSRAPDAPVSHVLTSGARHWTGGEAEARDGGLGGRAGRTSLPCPLLLWVHRPMPRAARAAPARGSRFAVHPSQD